jgi:hypothetical protein
MGARDFTVSVMLDDEVPIASLGYERADRIIVRTQGVPELQHGGACWLPTYFVGLLVGLGSFP